MPRLGRDPLKAIFDGHCCWPGCSRDTHDEQVPICKEHLIVAWRIANTTMENVLDSFRSMPRPEPAPRIPVAKDGTVYFIRFGDRVKIGWTSNLTQRMADLPHDEILGTVPGSMKDEKRAHAAWKHLRITGEWFHASPELLDWINDVRAA